MLDPVFSDPPLLPVSQSTLIRQTEPVAFLHILSLVCSAREVLFCLGECM
ncbi:unnamed protein product [Staurois parvus]|uniref:Uncharacterized protein n=1 Tax=Staurois parvus TaxID=386267 RepID=A0ABN9F996_9NEOB|nr:unnamed protein product [Staurois parvus]